MELQYFRTLLYLRMNANDFFLEYLESTHEHEKFSSLNLLHSSLLVMQIMEYWNRARTLKAIEFNHTPC